MPYTEQQIRGLAINFLRFHYKLRPRFAGGGTQVVDQPHHYKDVLIDARLAFQHPDESWFTATIEATSVDKTEEIFYRVNYWRTAVHALVITLVTLTPFIWIPTKSGLVPKLHLWKLYGQPEAFVVLAAIFALTFLILGAVLSQWRGYRYIYAVDQFKQFHASAQWVAFDAKIFAADTVKTRRRYAELERQCVKYGFGMLVVEDDKVVRNLMSPSEVEQFGGKRLRLPGWLARAGKLAQRSTDAQRAANALASVYTSRSLPGYYKLGGWVYWLGVPALLLFGWGVVVQATYSPVAREGRRGAEPDLTALESTENPVPPLEIEEGEYRAIVDTVAGEELAVDLPEESLVASERIEDLAQLRRYRILEDGGVRIDYDCVPLYQLSEPVFVLLFGRYDSFGAAREWAEELNRLYRSAVTVAAGDCVEISTTGYLVYLDGPMTEEAQANFRVRQLLQEGLEVEILEIED